MANSINTDQSQAELFGQAECVQIFCKNWMPMPMTCFVMSMNLQLHGEFAEKRRAGVI